MKKYILMFFLLPFFAAGQIPLQFITLKPGYVNYIQFNYTGGGQTWIVPSGVSEIFVDVIGAQGGTKGAAAGGLGGRIRATVKVVPGETLYLMVGGQPTTRLAVYGNAGDAGNNTNNTNNISLAGGGMSAIFRTSIVMANALIVAGGGGGAAGAKPGGDAGGTVGSVFDIRSGRGGTQTAGGATGEVLDLQTVDPTAGQLGIGGKGGSTATSTWSSGGGGGAGYYGGGGGVAGGAGVGTGGGGSSWAHPTATANIANIKSYNSGHGKLTIYW